MRRRRNPDGNTYNRRQCGGTPVDSPLSGSAATGGVGGTGTGALVGGSNGGVVGAVMNVNTTGQGTGTHTTGAGTAVNTGLPTAGTGGTGTGGASLGAGTGGYAPTPRFSHAVWRHEEVLLSAKPLGCANGAEDTALVLTVQSDPELDTLNVAQNSAGWTGILQALGSSAIYSLSDASGALLQGQVTLRVCP